MSQITLGFFATPIKQWDQPWLVAGATYISLAASPPRVSKLQMDDSCACTCVWPSATHLGTAFSATRLHNRVLAIADETRRFVRVSRVQLAVQSRRVFIFFLRFELVIVGAIENASRRISPPIFISYRLYIAAVRVSRIYLLITIKGVNF